MIYTGTPCLRQPPGGPVGLSLLFAFLLLAIPTFSQEKTVYHSQQQWFQYYSHLHLGKKWSLLADGGYRWKDGFQESTQYIARAALGRSINSDMQVAVGVGHFGAYSDGELSRMEFRPYQELNLHNTFNRISIHHRYRVEERFFYPISDGEIQTPPSFHFRFRYSAMVDIPLFQLRKDREESAFSILFGDEVFIQAGEDIVYNVFGQNRFLLGPSFKMSEDLTISMMWNYQFAGTSTPGDFKTTHAAWLKVKHQLGRSTKKPNQ